METRIGYYFFVGENIWEQPPNPAEKTFRALPENPACGARRYGAFT